ncbi:MAG: phosphohistidine phosphatase SixA [Steroidobacteraceae bacterium]
MELLVLRHAIAFPRDASRWPDDSQRPLTAEGVRRARRAAAGLKRLGKAPGVVMTSPLVRARDTAKIFAQAARWPEAVECDALVPDGEAEEVLAALRGRSGKTGCAAVVGHQPHLGRLIALCLRGGLQPEAMELKKSAVACLQFDGPPHAGRAVLEWLLAPRILRQLE